MPSFHGYTGQPSTRRHGQKTTFTQADTRHPGVTYDQHGREHSCEIDNRSGMPTSPLMPLFSAPWFPDLAYIKVNPDNTNECYIDYQQMYRERKGRLTQYHNEAVRWCMENGKPTPERGEYPEYIQYSTVGAPPRALELVAAAAQENPWVLGFTEKQDPRLVRFIETRYTSETLEEIADVFDFGAESYYAAAEGQVVAPEKVKPAKYRSFAEVAKAQGRPVDAVLQEATSDPALAEAEAQLNEHWDGASGGEQLAEGEEAEETHLDFEEDEDSEALGGRTINPKKTAVAEKQAPKRTHQRKGPAPAKKIGGGRPSLADGAIPYIGGDPRE